MYNSVEVIKYRALISTRQRYGDTTDDISIDVSLLIGKMLDRSTVYSQVRKVAASRRKLNYWFKRISMEVVNWTPRHSANRIAPTQAAVTRPIPQANDSTLANEPNETRPRNLRVFRAIDAFDPRQVAIER